MGVAKKRYDFFNFVFRKISPVKLASSAFVVGRPRPWAGSTEARSDPDLMVRERNPATAPGAVSEARRRKAPRAEKCGDDSCSDFADDPLVFIALSQTLPNIARHPRCSTAQGTSSMGPFHSCGQPPPWTVQSLYCRQDAPMRKGSIRMRVRTRHTSMVQGVFSPFSRWAFF